MKLIELHILQSFPVSCLNRDDVGAPKTAQFGGAQRARISSQSLKRAIRLHARDELQAARFSGIRSRLLLEPFAEALAKAGYTDDIPAKARELCEVFSKMDEKEKNAGQVTTAVFLSPAEIDQIAAAVAAGEDPVKAARKAERLDAADIALFGRMVANDASLNIEGAAMFSHALSTHAASNEVDFFAAVDDRKDPATDAGAGMIGTLEYTSALYYRYAALNLDLLAADSHLGRLTPDDRKAVVDAFLRSTLMAVPGARQRSMNANTRPVYALGIAKTKGQPVQLVNAFEQPVQSQDGYKDKSIKKLEAELKLLKETWGMETADETTLPDFNLDTFIATLLAHVH